MERFRIWRDRKKIVRSEWEMEGRRWMREKVTNGAEKSGVITMRC